MTEKPKRILKFVSDRRRPVTAKMVAQHFAIASSTASTHLRHLHETGYLTRQEIKGKVIWFKTGQNPVAVPEELTVAAEKPIAVPPPAPVKWEHPKPMWPVNPFKTSYPNIRGYDD